MKKIIAIIVILVILLGAGVGGYLYYSKEQVKKDNETVETIVNEFLEDTRTSNYDELADYCNDDGKKDVEKLISQNEDKIAEGTKMQLMQVLPAIGEENAKKMRESVQALATYEITEIELEKNKAKVDYTTSKIQPNMSDVFEKATGIVDGTTFIEYVAKVSNKSYEDVYEMDQNSSEWKVLSEQVNDTICEDFIKYVEDNVDEFDIEDKEYTIELVKENGDWKISELDL